MRQQIKRLREQGYGRMVEVPLPTYLQAALLGVAHPAYRVIHYLLPKGELSAPGNYVRAVEGADGDFRVTPERDDRPEFYRSQHCQVIQPFGRGVLIHRNDNQILQANCDPDTKRRQHLFFQYLVQLDEEIKKQKGWSLTLRQYALAVDADWARELMACDLFTLYEEAMFRWRNP